MQTEIIASDTGPAISVEVAFRPVSRDMRLCLTICPEPGTVYSADVARAMLASQRSAAVATISEHAFAETVRRANDGAGVARIPAIRPTITESDIEAMLAMVGE